MDEYRGSDNVVAPNKGINPWLALALVTGVVVGIVLLLVWGASASPSGGCGGG